LSEERSGIAAIFETIDRLRPARGPEWRKPGAWQLTGGSPRPGTMAGRYFDEWTVGDRIAHAITRTVTETDNVLISTLTHNPQPMHLDHDLASRSEFGMPLVNSVFTFGLMIGVSVGDTTMGTLVANLGYDS
jgi:acyl dehydratase